MNCLHLFYRASTINKIGDLNLTPSHPPTTDIWKSGLGQYPSNKINISGWNVNGYRSIMSKGILNKFMQIYQPDFMCLNQTKINYKYFKQISQELQNPFKEYYGYWNFCKIKAGYSGVTIFSKYMPMNIIQDFPSTPQHSLQGRVITLEYQSFYIINIYKPSSGMNLQRLTFRTQQFDLTFKNYVEELMKKKPVIIFGDMNVAHHEIDLAKPRGKSRQPGFTYEERNAFTQLLQNNKLIDTFRLLHPTMQKYSWWSYRSNARAYNNGWRLDYILADTRLKIQSAAIHNQFQGSDHCPVSATINLSN